MGYLTFKEDVRAFLKDIKHKPYFALALLALFPLVFILLTAMGTAVSNWVTGKMNPVIVKGYTPPPLTLTYGIVLKTIWEEDGPRKGLNKTFFSIGIHQPPGNFETKFPIITNIPNAECTDPKELASERWSMGAIGSSTYSYVVECFTHYPIVDNGKLFSLGSPK